MGVLRPEGHAADEPVAFETPVVATGARPGPSGSKRELFSEETQTVLVFEKGAVIRLSAGVVDGQLLFLTNKKTGKEVVTQVVRKRSFRPTSCYVDLEFTEASPGFWGLELPKSAPAVPGHAAGNPDEEEPSDSAKPSVPPDLQEVARLKNEVAELQTRLKTLTGSSAGEGAAPLPLAAASETQVGETVEQHEEKLLAQLFAQEAQQEQLHGPQRLVAYPKKKKSSVAKAASKAATAGAFAAVVVAAAVAVYRFGLFDSLLAKPAASKPAPASPIAAVLPSAAKPASAIPMPAPSNVAPRGRDATAEENLTGKSRTEAGADPGAIDARQPYLVPGSRVPAATSSGAKRPGSTTTANSADVPARTGSPSDSAVPVAESGATAAEAYVAPKLVYSVKPVSPPEALRNYVTGNVSVDALVDVSGHVKSVSVISGPQKLRNTAIAEMKQYRYEPARKNGKPVAAHVQVSLKYWYEP